MPTSDDDGISENTSKRNHDKSQNDWPRAVDDAEKRLLEKLSDAAMVIIEAAWRWVGEQCERMGNDTDSGWGVGISLDDTVI